MAEQVVYIELNRLEVVPADAAARYVEQRALVRYETLRDNYVDMVCASEDWARFCIPPRASPSQLHHACASQAAEDEGHVLHFCQKEVLHLGDGGPGCSA